MGISQIFGPNCPEISGSQRNPFRTSSFKLLKEDIILIRKEKTNRGH